MDTPFEKVHGIMCVIWEYSFNVLYKSKELTIITQRWFTAMTILNMHSEVGSSLNLCFHFILYNKHQQIFYG